MAYVVPDSEIYLLKNVHLDPSYTDTIYFANQIEQSNYFVGLASQASPNTGVHLEDYSYQRTNRGTIRVEGNAENLYNVNYMMFKNTAFGSKWFYAFVMKADYINNNTVELTYEIDVIQTWLFETVLEPSFVEREHQSTDTIGDNILPEPIDTGDLVCESIVFPSEFKNLSVIIAYVGNLPSN